MSSIRAGERINDLVRIAESTLTAIMGREAAYTGQSVESDEALNADQASNGAGPPGAMLPPARLSFPWDFSRRRSPRRRAP